MLKWNMNKSYYTVVGYSTVHVIRTIHQSVIKIKLKYDNYCIEYTHSTLYVRL